MNGRAMLALVFAVSGLLAAAVAHAQGPHQGSRSASAPTRDPRVSVRQLHDSCGPELHRFCPAAGGNLRGQADCLRAYHLDLSLSCRIALKRRDGGTAEGQSP